MSKLVKFNTSDEEKIFDKSIKKILFISGVSSYYKTGADKIFENKFNDKEKYIYIKKSYYPNFEELKEIINIKDEIKPDLIVAIGGGCVIDYSKISSVFNISKNFKNKLINSDYERNKKTPLLAIPTTAGSGAEVTSNAVIYINNIKYSVEGPEVRPEYYALLPKLLLSSTMKIDSSSGFDAISQAIESILSKKSNTQSINYASRALRILFKNYTQFIQKKNISNSYKMALGANLAGKAINISKTTAPHALSYPFTAHFNVPHGHAVSLSLNKFLKFNYNFKEKAESDFNLEKRYKLLFKLSNTRNIDQLDRFLIKIKQIAKLEQNFKKLGININKNYSLIIGGLNSQRLKNNPISVSKKDIKIILDKY
jgi:alcohol dehydrogenase